LTAGVDPNQRDAANTLPIFDTLRLAPFLQFTPDLVVRDRPSEVDGPIVHAEPDAPAEHRPDRPEISAARGRPGGDQQKVDDRIDRRVDRKAALRPESGAGKAPNEPRTFTAGSKIPV
jgi:hypothetical protein